MSHRKLPRRGIHRPPGAWRALSLGLPRGPAALRALEERAARTLGLPQMIALGSGRLALELLLLAISLPAGSEVLLPALTFHAVPAAIERAGLRPVFVDVDPATLLLDPQALVRRFTRRSGAVLATWLAGLTGDPTPLQRFCEEHGLVLLEDFAQAAGARWAGRPVGGFGLAGFTSLETVKPLSGFGGGLITCADPDVVDRLRAAVARLDPPDMGCLLRKLAFAQVEGALARPAAFTLAWPFYARDSEGRIARYKASKRRAANHRAALHPLQARAALASLDHLESHLRERRQRAETLRAALPTACWWPRVPAEASPSWYQVLVRCGAPWEAVAAARRAGVDLGAGVVQDLSDGTCPHAARAARELVQVPCHPDLGPLDVARVAEVVSPWLV